MTEACKLINEIKNINGNQRIFICCNAGMTRSPTLAILYLCLYCEIDCW